MKQVLITILILFICYNIVAQRIVIQKVSTKQYVKCVQPKLLLTYNYGESLEFEREEVGFVLNMLNKKKKLFKIKAK